MNCKFCGSPVNEGALFCTNCGVTLADNNKESAADVTVDLTKSATEEPQVQAQPEPQPIDAYAQVNPNSPYAPQQTAVPTADQSSAYAPQNNTYAQNTGAYSQTGAYNQGGMYSQNNAYAQNAGAYNQNSVYGQNSAYGQNGVYGQNGAYGQNAGVYNQNGAYGQGSVYNQGNMMYGSTGNYTYKAPVAAPANDGSTATMVLGIVSLALSVTFYFSIASVVMAPISIARAVNYKKHNGQMNGKCKVGLGLSIGALALCAIYLLIFVFAFVIALSEY